MTIETLKRRFPEIREADLWVADRVLNEHAQTQTLLKGVATYLSKRSEAPIKRTKAIERMAVVMGFKSWNVAKSALPTGKFDFTNVTKRSFEGVGPNTFRLLPARLFETASRDVMRRVEEDRMSGPWSKIGIVSKADEAPGCGRRKEITRPGPTSLFIKHLVDTEVSRPVRHLLRSNVDCVIFHGEPAPDDWRDLAIASLTGHCVFIFADVKTDGIPVIKVGEDAAGAVLFGLAPPP